MEKLKLKKDLSGIEVAEWMPFKQKLLRQKKYKQITKAEILSKLKADNATKIEINNYFELIPDLNLRKVQEAKKFGFKDFYVYIKKDDPVIIAEIGLGDFKHIKYFITEW